ncbi:N-acetyltransferase [Candidatus Thorarchaeota archaeon]|nr:MAG: N-acetyltransferase [Candidatus Thorarchaeota archaeon]
MQFIGKKGLRTVFDEIYQCPDLHQPMYNGRLVYLRALAISDLDPIMESYNQWELRRWMGVPIPKSREVMREWLEKSIRLDPWRDGRVYFAVLGKESRSFLGIARFYDVKVPHMRASIGVSIYVPDKRSMGYGTDTTRLMLWFGFHVLGLHSIYLDTMDDNTRAIHVAEKAGFKKVGVFRETEFVDGEYKGLLYMDILRDEFMKEYPPGTMIDD